MRSGNATLHILLDGESTRTSDRAAATPATRAAQQRSPLPAPHGSRSGSAGASHPVGLHGSLLFPPAPPPLRRLLLPFFAVGRIAATQALTGGWRYTQVAVGLGYRKTHGIFRLHITTLPRSLFFFALPSPLDLYVSSPTHLCSLDSSMASTTSSRPSRDMRQPRKAASAAPA